MKTQHRLPFALACVGLALLAGFLAVGWVATWSLGIEDVRESRGLTVSQLEHRKPDDPPWTAHSRAWSPLPFLVVVDWSRTAPPHHGHAERTTILWFFGLQIEIRRQIQWIS